MDKLDTYKDFIYYRTYARWLPEQQRRENWEDTVSRYTKFFQARLPTELHQDFDDAMSMCWSKDVMPSMRCLWTAGKALDKENIAGYNCAYTAIDSPKTLAEILYILMCGTGIGFSVERQFIAKLPVIPESILEYDTILVFQDSKLGWAEGYYHLLQLLYSGVVPQLDYSEIRPKGALLKTFGGRASGPQPLQELCTFTIQTFKDAQGRKLNSIEVFDIVCKISSCVQVGGVRRSATICLTNLSDRRMSHAKEGEWWRTHPYRAFANVSVAYTEKPSIETFMDEWIQLMKAKSGERGIINREGMIERNKHRNFKEDCGINPCSEIDLHSKQFCNLSEVIVYPYDTLETLLQKVKTAALFGVVQSTLTKFDFLDSTWKKNCEKERLIGVSLTGVCDHPYLSKKLYAKKWLPILRDHTIACANHFADILGINRPASYTCIKPSGTVSQLVNTASGLHPRFAKYYIRRVRVSSNDPIATFLCDRNVPWQPEVGETKETCNTKVFEFPIKSPAISITRSQLTAIEQLDFWKIYKWYWCTHNPSVTIYVKDDEWLEVGSWVYKNWEFIGGLSFLPYDGGSYPLMPYEEINNIEYEKLIRDFPVLKFSELPQYEITDTTTGSREFACVGGSCEI